MVDRQVGVSASRRIPSHAGITKKTKHIHKKSKENVERSLLGLQLHHSSVARALLASSNGPLVRVLVVTVNSVLRQFPFPIPSTIEHSQVSGA